MSSELVSGLPFNLDDLLHHRVVEGNRIEFKGTWDAYTRDAVVRTTCAFANDLLNLNGGYIVIGAEEEGGHLKLPPRGLAERDLERVQKEIRGACARLQPTYQPLLFPTVYRERSLLLVWAPGGETRPYQAPESARAKGSSYHYYVRQGPETVKARGELLRQLMELAAKVPFDDRRNLDARIEDLSPTLVRRFLHEIQSDLVAGAGADLVDDRELYRKLQIVSRVNAHEVPRNVGLLFFHEQPDRFFPCAKIEIVHFGEEGDLLDERTFSGPLPQQIRETLRYLNSLGGTVRQKIPGRAEAEVTVPYPFAAMEESVVNAVYHRGYDYAPDPLKIYRYGDRMEITAYPGPVSGLQPEDFLPGAAMPPVRARNRRIGELLRELRLAEAKGTGIAKIQRVMRQNGSPPARFDFDEERTYFRVTLPVHPRYRQLQTVVHGGRSSRRDEPSGPQAGRDRAAQPSALAAALERAYLQKAERESRGLETTEIREEILSLRRQLREGGRLYAGDFFADGRFKLLEPIGVGGFATVWRAYDRGRRVVAIKILHGQYAADRTRRERFFRGARKMAELQHPGIVRVIEEKMEEGGWFFFVMEYLEGGDFRQRILADDLAASERLPIIRAVGEALDFAHRRGIIHRDIKPGNILLNRQDRPKLTDFDLVWAEDTTGGTRTGVLGSVLYTAPEAMQEAANVDVSVDVYGLGMTTIFSLYGADLPLDVLRDAPGFIAELPIARPLADVLCRAVAWAPEERYPSVAAFLAALATATSGP